MTNVQHNYVFKKKKKEWRQQKHFPPLKRGLPSHSVIAKKYCEVREISFFFFKGKRIKGRYTQDLFAREPFQLQWRRHHNMTG